MGDNLAQRMKWIWNIKLDEELDKALKELES